MINQLDEKIGTREFIAIIWLAVGMKVTYTAPNFLYEVGSVAAWMFPFFYAITIGIPFLILLSLLKKHEKGLPDLFVHLTGKHIGSFLSFVFFLVVFSKIIFDSQNYSSIVNNYFYPKIPGYVIPMLLFACSVFIAKRGFSTIANGIRLIVPILIFSLFILLFLSWGDINWGRMFPVAGPGLGKIMRESVANSSTFGEFILLAALFPLVRSFKSFRYASFVGFGMTLFTMIVFLISFVLIFDYTLLLKMEYPYLVLTRMVHIGTHIDHLEGLFFMIWIIGTMFRFAIFLYLTVIFLGAAIRLEKFEPLLLPVTGLLFLSSILPANTFTIAPLQDVFITISSGIFIVLPFILWIMDTWKGRKKHEAT